MRIFKRFVCAFLALLLLSVFPLTALATPAISLNPTSYVISLLLDACGIQVNTTALSSFVSTVSGYDEYVELGKNKQLGAYSQWIYDNRIAHQEEIEKARADFMDAFGWMIDLGNATWGEDIKLADGALNRAYAGIKEWLATFPSYGTDNPDYSVPTALEYPYYANVKDSRTISAFNFDFTTAPSTDAYIVPSYRPLSSGGEIGYDIISLERLSGTYYSTFYKDVLSFRSFNHSVTIDGKSYVYYYSTLWLSDRNETVSYFFDTSADNLMIDEGSSHYTVTEYYAKELLFANIKLPVGAVKSDLQDKVLAGLGDAISLPADEATAEKKLSGIDFGDSLESIFKAIADAGIVLNPGIDIPGESESTGESETTGEGEDTETKTTLSAILAKVGAIPAEIGAMLRKMLEPEDTDKDVENMKLPTSIADKFPFCIPFDVIYLVKAMNASSEVPRFELPFKIHYQNINYEHTFVVDMTDWDVAVKILRTMLDLLFIAGLISTTRELIRG